MFSRDGTKLSDELILRDSSAVVNNVVNDSLRSDYIDDNSSFDDEEAD